MEKTVTAENLVKRYKELIALDHFNLEIERGELFGLLGPNGSGKTTAIQCMLGVLTLDKGTVRLFGQKMAPDNYALKRKIGIVPQAIAVFNELSVYENIDYFCGLYVKDKETRKQCVDYAVSFAELSDFKKFAPKKLSGGLARRLNIACGIAHKPQLIIMDEPTVAVDPQSRAHILEGIRTLNREGATILYTTHYMEEAEELCDRIAIMDKGRVIAIGTCEQLKEMIRNGETITVKTQILDNTLKDLLKQQKNVFAVSQDAGVLTVKCEKGDGNLKRVLNFLEQQGIPFGQIETRRPTLNDVFLEITGRELRDGGEN